MGTPPFLPVRHGLTKARELVERVVPNLTRTIEPSGEVDTLLVAARRELWVGALINIY